MDKHVLRRCRRAEFVSFAPIRKSGVIVVLLVILLIVRKVLNALGAVCTILSLGGRNASTQYQSRRSEKDVSKFFHIVKCLIVSIKSKSVQNLIVHGFLEPNIENIESYIKPEIVLPDKSVLNCSLLSKLQSDGYSIISCVNRNCSSEGDSI